MALFDDALRTGHYTVKADTIEGIPYIFAEVPLIQVTGSVVSLASGYTLSTALAIEDGTSTSVDCNREEGIAAASELDILLGRDQLEREGLLEAIFTRPTRRATLTASITSAATTTFAVDDTSAWPSSGSFYIGRELCTYSGKTSTTFTGATRGVCGLPHYHTASTRSAYRQCTDTPVYWVGRIVTRWEHLVSPEGRYLGTQWCTPGPYCRQVWRGVIVEQPKPTAGGMRIRCEALVRALASEVGASIQGRMVFDSSGLPFLYVRPADGLRIREAAQPGVDAEGHIASAQAIVSVANWCTIVAQNLRNQLPSGDTISIFPNGSGVHVRLAFQGSSSHEFSVWPDAWFLARAERQAVSRGDGIGEAFLQYAWDMPQWGTTVTDAWIVVEFEPNVDYTDADVPSSGVLLITVGEQSELVRYSDATLGYGGRFWALRIVARGVNTGERINIWTSDSVEVRIVSQADTERMVDGVRTLATSSGLGSRGAFDVLGFGFGLGLPDEYIDADSFPDVRYALRASEREPLSKLFAGYLALHRQCLAQVVDSDGEVILRAVQTDAVADVDGLELGPDDVLMDGHEEPELIESPNHLVVETGESAGSVVVRDAARVQAEGRRKWEFKAPGITATTALQLAGDIMVLSDGVQSVRFRLPPWLAQVVQLGDVVQLTTEHPALYSWADGVWAPAQAFARVVGHERDHADDTAKVTCLIAGQAGEALFVCPSADQIGSDGADTIRVTKGHAQWFRVGEDVGLYRPGNEAATFETLTIDAISTANPSYDRIDFTTNIVQSIPSSGLVMTFPLLPDASARQSRHLYHLSSQSWT